MSSLIFDFGATGPFAKICGVTNAADAGAAIREGADALGINFFEGSKRFVPLPEAAEWLPACAGKVARVAVTVNPSAEFVAELAGSGLFEAVQFHGDESPEFCAASGFPIWIKAVAAKDAATLEGALAYRTPFLLVDAYSADARGGTGKLPDWGLVREFVRANPGRRIILAGGLTPGNVAEAVRAVGPYALDVASGVEIAPGKKDPAAIRKFIGEIKAAGPVNRE